METSDSLRQKKIKFFFVLYLTHPHVMRHTFCTRLANAGMNPKALQYVMGHSNITITLNLYTHASLETVKSELQRFVA